MPRRFGIQTMGLRRELRQAVRELAECGSDYSDVLYMLDCGIFGSEAKRLLADAQAQIARELASIVVARLADKGRAIDVDLDDLAPGD